MAILLISTELDEILNLSDRILVLYEGEVMGESSADTADVETLGLMMAGTKAAQATSLSQAFGGAGIEPQPAIAQLLMMAGLCLVAMAGLPERLAQLLVLSYDLFPAGAWPSPGAVAQWGTGRVARSFALAFSLAAPFVIGAGLYNLALGAINRAMPQLMVAFVGAPALTLGGLVLLMLVAPLMMAVWLPAFLGLLADPVMP